MKRLHPNLYALGLLVLAILLVISNFAAWFVNIHNSAYNCRQNNLIKKNIRDAEVNSREKALKSVDKPGTIYYDLYHNHPQEFQDQIRDINKLIDEFRATDCSGLFAKK